MIAKAALHRLLDELPESELEHAVRYLAYLRDTADPLQQLLDHAPEDDEPLTPEEETAIEEGLAAYRRGDYISPEEAKHELLS
jgi:hypothetical protein